jgi:hypothetical protein
MYIYIRITHVTVLKGAKDNKGAYTQLAQDAGRFVLTITEIVKPLNPKNLPPDLVQDIRSLIEYAPLFPPLLVH